MVLRKFWGVKDISFWGMEGIIFFGGSGNFIQTQENNLIKPKTCLQSFSSMNIPYKWTHVYVFTCLWVYELPEKYIFLIDFMFCLTKLRFNPTVGLCMLSSSIMSYSLWPYGPNPPGSSVHGIFRVRILECVAINFSRGSSRPRNQTHISSPALPGAFFITSITRKVYSKAILYLFISL